MKLTTKTILPIGNHKGTVIFLHGSGDTGRNVMEWVRILLGRDIQHTNVKFVFPTAPVQPYTPLNGALSNVWFDRESISIEAKENNSSLLKIYQAIDELIQNETECGIPPQKIIVGGFSMGGALALHTGYHLNRNIAGVFACSSFLNKDSVVYDSLKGVSQNLNLPELLMFHGERDSLVPASWGEETFRGLSMLGVKGEFILLKETFHELKKKQVIIIEEWITKTLKIENNIQNKL